MKFVAPICITVTLLILFLPQQQSLLTHTSEAQCRKHHHKNRTIRHIIYKQKGYDPYLYKGNPRFKKIA
jgi:hypothetical protein